MRTDSDLWFLDQCSNKQLEFLYNILTLEIDGSYRKRERLSNSLESEIYGTDYYKYSDRIALELQYQSNDVIGDLLRQNLREYRDILVDIMIVQNIEIMGFETAEQLEEELILTLNDRALGIQDAGIYSMPFDVLLAEAMNEEVMTSPIYRAIVPAVIYISILRLEQTNNQNNTDVVKVNK
ncbi:DUF3944 domain-containing protein [Flammeovirga sp. SubArs3]|uniref:DUF3944 domain-containing protein n=1 Tax=Flammeovirga sp. SubArs3 TaxID=2995316 RepID=UPI00248B6B77|nr:DUF3944 domain-containing protein [Flammeovirga sp. SubArs3]